VTIAIRPLLVVDLPETVMNVLRLVTGGARVAENRCVFFPMGLPR
jgi:hypothetical protein